MHGKINSILPVILAGGEGKRLAPLSSAQRPKQFLDLIEDNQSMLQTTLGRFKNPVFKPPLIVTNKQYQPLIETITAAPELQNTCVLYEKTAAGTALAITLSLLYVNEVERGAYALICPSDHYISDTLAFQKTVLMARNDNNPITLFGVKPTSPFTGYGYIGVKDGAVFDFTEKPDLDIAQSYLDSGEYFWNSGIFLMKSDDALELIKDHCPRIYAAAQSLWTSAEQSLNRIDINAAENLESISIDKALLENLESVHMMRLNCEWADLGTWETLNTYKKEHSS